MYVVAFWHLWPFCVANLASGHLTNGQIRPKATTWRICVAFILAFNSSLCFEVMVSGSQATGLFIIPFELLGCPN